MNQNLNNYYKNINTYDLLAKLPVSNIFQIPLITSLYLNIGFKNANIDKKELINILVLLKLISNQKPVVTISKKNNILLKIKKGSIIGCKTTIRGKNMYFFLEKLIIFIISNEEKKIKINFQSKDILNFQIKDILSFFELKNEFLRFKEKTPIDISIHTNSKNSQTLFLLLNSMFLIKK